MSNLTEFQLNLYWTTKDKKVFKVKDMTRGHIQNSLNWCLKQHQDHPDLWFKDGISFEEWNNVFFIRLLDTDLQ